MKMPMDEADAGKRFQALPLITFAGILVGASVVASRFAVGQMHPAVFLSSRLSLAAIVYTLVLTIRGWPRDRRLWIRAAAMGICVEALSQFAVLTALQVLSSGVTSLVTTLQPALVVLFAHFLLPDEKLTRLKLVGLLLAVSGSALLALRGENGLGNEGEDSVIGYSLLLFSMLVVSAMSIFARRFLREFDPIQVTGVQIITAALVVTPLTALFVGLDYSSVNTQGQFAVVFSAIASPFLGALILFYILKQFGATNSAMVFYVIPIAATIGGILLLDEKFTVNILAGMVLILAGITLIRQGQNQQVVSDG